MLGLLQQVSTTMLHAVCDNSCSTSCLISSGMGSYRQVGKPVWYVTSHPGQLSLAITLCVGTMSTSEI